MTPASTNAITIIRTPRTPSTPTRRVCEACALLGVSADTLLAPAQPSPEAFALDLAPSSITLITGASGSGKSTLLREIAAAARRGPRPIIKPTSRDLPDKPVVDLVGQDASEAMCALARVGLAEAACFVRRPSQLSEGQRWRLRLAIALARALRRGSPTKPAILLCDEFASTLDADTAASVAHLVRRLADRSGRLTLVLATPRADLGASLAPETRIHCTGHGPLRIDATPAPRTAPAFVIEPGTRTDLDALAALHYRADAPATIVRILKAAKADSGRLAGVLVASMPTLNASWRELAWPGRYSTGSRRERATRVNRELRCISRVIVHPAFRGLGIARRLVEHYLADPATPCTEALAAMGRVSPFFARAGMTPYLTPPTQRDARLLDALEHAGVEAWRLSLPAQSLDRAIRGTTHAFIERETRLWARASRASAPHARDDLPALFARACRAISAKPVAYAHTAT